MDFIKPFVKKEPSQQALMEQERKFQQEDAIIASALHPQDIDAEAFAAHQNMMAELTRWQQDLSPMLKELFKNLAGLMENAKSELVQVPNFSPVCNYNAAKRWIDFITPLDKNVMNGAWTIKQINDSMIAIDQTITQDLIEHWKFYEVEYSIATFDYICNAIINAVYPTFLRGLENGERRCHGQIQKIIETKSLNAEKKKTLFGEYWKYLNLLKV